MPIGAVKKTVYLSLMEIEKMDNVYFKLGLDYESNYAYVWKQNPDIRRNLQLNPVSIYTKFWTVSQKENLT